MKVSYYPGCSLSGTAREYNESARAVCAALAIELEELPQWTCCGASSAHATNHKLALALPLANLAHAALTPEKPLVVPCSACFNRLKTADKEATPALLKELELKYEARVDIRHLADFLGAPELVREIRAQVVRPLAGLKVVPYYGCLMVRPPKVLDRTDHENPQSMDRILKALGVEVRPWSYKTDCCGGPFMLTRPDLVRTLSGKLFAMAKQAGADCLVTCCPVCQGNLDTRQKEIEAEQGESFELPLFYFTELIGLALNLKKTRTWMGRHLVSPKRLLQEKSLW